MKKLLVFAALIACGPPATPSSIVDRWELDSVEGTQGGKIPATKVMQLGLDADGGVKFVSCLDPVYEGTTLFTCHEQQVCATGTYAFTTSVLSITQTGRSDVHSGTVTFTPGGMSLSGEFFGPSYKALNFKQLTALSTDCSQLP